MTSPPTVFLITSQIASCAERCVNEIRSFFYDRLAVAFRCQWLSCFVDFFSQPKSQSMHRGYVLAIGFCLFAFRAVTFFLFSRKNRKKRMQKVGNARADMHYDFHSHKYVWRRELVPHSHSQRECVGLEGTIHAIALSLADGKKHAIWSSSSAVVGIADVVSRVHVRATLNGV